MASETQTGATGSVPDINTYQKNAKIVTGRTEKLGSSIAANAEACKSQPTELQSAPNTVLKPVENAGAGVNCLTDFAPGFDAGNSPGNLSGFSQSGKSGFSMQPIENTGTCAEVARPVARHKNDELPDEKTANCPTDFAPGFATIDAEDLFRYEVEFEQREQGTFMQVRVRSKDGSRFSYMIGTFRIGQLTKRQLARVQSKTLPADVKAAIAKGELDYEVIAGILARTGKGQVGQKRLDAQNAGVSNRTVSKVRSDQRRAGEAVGGNPAPATRSGLIN